MARLIIQLMQTSISAGSSGFKKDDLVLVKVATNEWYFGRVAQAGVKVSVKFKDGSKASIEEKDFKHIKNVAGIAKSKMSKKPLNNVQAKEILLALKAKAKKEAAKPAKPNRTSIRKRTSLRVAPTSSPTVDAAPTAQSSFVQVGFWANTKREHNKPYPFPEENTGSGAPTGWKDMEDNCRMSRSRGLSRCRICKQNNGGGTYSYTSKTTGKTYEWPEGFKHYLTKHKVAVPKEARELIRAYKADKEGGKKKSARVKPVVEKPATVKRSSTERRVEGFYRSKQQPNLPMPVARSKKWSGQDEFVAKLKRIQGSGRAPGQTKGLAPCRICKRGNGSGTYSKKNWSWPEGFIHYVVDHNVKPTQDFIDFIMGR